jgi:hypothetical protein
MVAGRAEWLRQREDAQEKGKAPVVPGNAFVPGANISFVPNSQVQDPAWKPGSHNQWDFTIQRELPANAVSRSGPFKPKGFGTHIVPND